MTVPASTRGRFASAPVSTSLRRSVAAMHAVDFEGIQLRVGGLEDAANWIAHAATDTAMPPSLVVHVNANNFHHLYNHPTVLVRLHGLATFLLDGIGMKFGSWLLGLGWSPDVNGTDLFPLVMPQLAKAKLSVYLVGATERVLNETVRQVRTRWPDLHIAGSTPGFFNPIERSKIADCVRASGADVLLVSRGSPVDEVFLVDQLTRGGVRLVWDLGGLFDVVSGSKPRAPRFLRQLRLEWLFRFALEPRRMWYRNLVVAPWFLSHVALRRLALCLGKDQRS